MKRQVFMTLTVRSLCRSVVQNRTQPFELTTHILAS